MKMSILQHDAFFWFFVCLFVDLLISIMCKSDATLYAHMPAHIAPLLVPRGFGSLLKKCHAGNPRKNSKLRQREDIWVPLSLVILLDFGRCLHQNCSKRSRSYAQVHACGCGTTARTTLDIRPSKWLPSTSLELHHAVFLIVSHTLKSRKRAHFACKLRTRLISDSAQALFPPSLCPLLYTHPYTQPNHVSHKSRPKNSPRETYKAQRRAKKRRGRKKEKTHRLVRCLYKTRCPQFLHRMGSPRLSVTTESQSPHV